jgi:hypothetical protein
MPPSEQNSPDDSGEMGPRSAVGRLRRGRQPGRVSGPVPADTGSHVVADTKAELVPQVEGLAGDAAHLKMLAVSFERWHQDMICMMTQNRNMHAMGEDLASIVRQLIMLSLNAAVEAARAGESARGFVVVAAEVRSLALRAQSLSKDLGNNLHKNDLMTTATFQDIQAGGKMMMAAISGLESVVQQLRSRLD